MKRTDDDICPDFYDGEVRDINADDEVRRDWDDEPTRKDQTPKCRFPSNKKASPRQSAIFSIVLVAAGFLIGYLEGVDWKGVKETVQSWCNAEYRDSIDSQENHWDLRLEEVTFSPDMNLCDYWPECTKELDTLMMKAQSSDVCSRNSAKLMANKIRIGISFKDKKAGEERLCTDSLYPRLEQIIDAWYVESDECDHARWLMQHVVCYNDDLGESEAIDVFIYDKSGDGERVIIVMPKMIKNIQISFRSNPDDPGQFDLMEDIEPVCDTANVDGLMHMVYDQRLIEKMLYSQDMLIEYDWIVGEDESEKHWAAVLSMQALRDVY